MYNVINPFKSRIEPVATVKYYSIDTTQQKPLFQLGDYAIYQNNSVSWVYTYKNLAFNELAGKNIEHLKAVATRTRPTDTQSKFLYERAIETLNNNLHLIN